MRLIDADALIPMMKYATTDNEIGVFPVKIGFDAIVKVINDSPTIETERKKGKWIYVNGHTAINCSACYHCGWSLSFEDTVKLFNFCPNCGADMRGEKE